MSANIERSVREWLTEHHVINQHVVVAVSGGVDSVTLLHVLSDVSADFELRLTVAHVDHGLRGIHSDADREFVHSLCDTLGVSCRSTIVDTQSLAAQSGKGIEASAREARYAFFTDAAYSLGAELIVTAHTLNDNVETFLMNAARGSGISGIAGIPPLRKLSSSVHVGRPLLECSRETVLRYARSKGLVWRNDDSNDSLEFTRNRVRHVVVPAIIEALGDTSLSGINTTITTLRTVRRGVRSMLSEQLDMVHLRTDGNLEIPLEALSTLPADIRGEFCHLALPHATLVDIERILQLLDAEVSTLASLSGKLVAIRERSSILIAPSNNEGDSVPLDVTYPSVTNGNGYTLTLEVAEPPVQVSNEHSRAYFDADQLTGRLTWRVWQDGDRIQPFGFDGSMLISDVLTNAHVEHSRRRAIHVLTDEQGILWVPGFRRCNRGLVGHTTKRVLIATLTPSRIDELQ